jgi:hypothetical protein
MHTHVSILPFPIFTNYRYRVSHSHCIHPHDAHMNTCIYMYIYIYIYKYMYYVGIRPYTHTLRRVCTCILTHIQAITHVHDHITSIQQKTVLTGYSKMKKNLATSHVHILPKAPQNEKARNRSIDANCCLQKKNRPSKCSAQL